MRILKKVAAIAVSLAALTSLSGCVSLFGLFGSKTPHECMTRVMYFESNRSSPDGMLAVGTVVMNRVNSHQFPGDVCGVVSQKNQFADGVLSRLESPHHLDRADLHSARGYLRSDLGEHDDAIADQRAALEIRREVLGNDHPEVAEALHGLSNAYFSAGRRVEAFTYLEEVLSIRERAFGDGHPAVAEVLNNLGVARTSTGDFRGARSALERALEIRRAALGQEHSRVANTLTALGDLAFEENEMRDAAALNRQALAIREKALGPDHPNLAQSLNRTDLPIAAPIGVPSAHRGVERAGVVLAAERALPEPELLAIPTVEIHPVALLPGSTCPSPHAGTGPVVAGLGSSVVTPVVAPVGSGSVGSEDASPGGNGSGSTVVTGPGDDVPSASASPELEPTSSPASDSVSPCGSAT